MEPTAHKVRLAFAELQLAKEVGALRQARAKARGATDRHGFRGDPLACHIRGVAAEIACAKALGLPWIDTPYVEGEMDFPGGIEARCRGRHWYDLLVWPNDYDDRRYVHLTKADGDPTYRIHGYMLGKDAKDPHYFRRVTSRAPSFFVPVGDLHDIEELR